MVFKDRTQAGTMLAEKLVHYKNNAHAIILGLPRGGVVVAHEVAKILGLPLDIIVTRKIAAPGNPELALGAVAQDGSLFLNSDLIEQMGLCEEDLRETINQERDTIRRRLIAYRKGRAPLDLTGKIAILVDDGIATGATLSAAITSARALGAKKVVVAVPVAPTGSVTIFKSITDEFVCLHEAHVFWGVGAFYHNFEQVEDYANISLLKN